MTTLDSELHRHSRAYLAGHITDAEYAERVSASEHEHGHHRGDHPHVYTDGRCTCGHYTSDAARDELGTRTLQRVSSAVLTWAALAIAVDPIGYVLADRERVTVVIAAQLDTAEPLADHDALVSELRAQDYARGPRSPFVTRAERRVLTRATCDHRPDNLPCKACGLGMTRAEQIARQMTRQRGTESETA